MVVAKSPNALICAITPGEVKEGIEDQYKYIKTLKLKVHRESGWETFKMFDLYLNQDIEFVEENEVIDLFIECMNHFVRPKVEAREPDIHKLIQAFGTDFVEIDNKTFLVNPKFINKQEE